MVKYSRLSGLVLLLGSILTFESCINNSRYTLEYVKPETEGFSSEKLESLKTHLKMSGASSLILVADGKKIFEWGKTRKKHTVHSIRKALLNSLYGIAVTEGVIDTTMTLRELGINDIWPDLSENELNACIADLLKSRSGVYHHAAGVSDAMLKNMPERDTYKPGEHFYYNNWDFNVLGAILEQKTGKSIYELFRDEIAIPLGMNDYKGSFCSIDGESDDEKIPDTDGFYQFEKSKSKYPAYHFRLSARDMALYGQLYLNKGNWNGKQIIPAKWIEVSTKPYSVYNSAHGIAYGMLWYISMPMENRDNKSFYHTGLGIHMLGIYPDSRLVLVHRVNTETDFKFKSEDLNKAIDLVFNSIIN